MKIFFSLETGADFEKSIPKKLEDKIQGNIISKKYLADMFSSMKKTDIEDIKNVLEKNNWILKSEYTKKNGLSLIIFDKGGKQIDETNIFSVLSKDAQKSQILNFLGVDTKSDLSLLVQKQKEEKNIIEQAKKELKKLETETN